MKKIIFLLIFVLMLSILPNNFSYGQKPEPFEVLKELGMLKGNPAGDLMLDDYLKRQDMVVLISRLYKEENKAKNYYFQPTFPDLADTNKFYHGYIQWSVDKGLIQGMTNGNFGYGLDVKVHDYQVVLLRALGYGEESLLYQSVPDIAKKFGLMEGVDAKSSDKLIRRDMATMTFNALNINKKGSPLTLADVLQLEVTN